MGSKRDGGILAAAVERGKRRSDKLRRAIVDQEITPEQLAEAIRERDEARSATADLATLYQQVCAERDQLRAQLGRRRGPVPA